jgi:flavin-dependent dehydrogenase
VSVGHYDIIIVGGSFAGLAVATSVRGRVLLLDRQPIGEGQTSACATPLTALERVKACEAILQIHDALMMHTDRGTAIWRPGVPFATFDYRRFCQTLLARADVDVKITAARRVDGQTVITDTGTFAAPLIVDATGWRAVLAGTLQADYVRRRLIGVGLETELPVVFPPGLHFYFCRDLIRHGYAWAFAAGTRTRFGVASYRAEAKLRGPLDQFLAQFGLVADRTHGGFLASGLRDPVVGPIFVVGDAAGQCLPLTGEGIRMAVRAGQFLGDQLQMVLDGRLATEDARAHYRAFVSAQRRHYAALAGFQIGLLQLAPSLLGLASEFMTWSPPLRLFFQWYMNIFSHPIPGAHGLRGEDGRDGWKTGRPAAHAG